MLAGPALGEGLQRYPTSPETPELKERKIALCLPDARPEAGAPGSQLPAGFLRSVSGLGCGRSASGGGGSGGRGARGGGARSSGRQRWQHVPHSGGRSRERSAELAPTPAARRGARWDDPGTGSLGDKCLEASQSRGSGEGRLGLPLQLLSSPPGAAEEELCGEAWVACHSERSWGSRYIIGFSLTVALEPLTVLGEKGRRCWRAERNREVRKHRFRSVSGYRKDGLFHGITY